jgi:hypothetical protein
MVLADTNSPLARSSASAHGRQVVKCILSAHHGLQQMPLGTVLVPLLQSTYIFTVVIACPRRLYSSMSNVNRELDIFASIETEWIYLSTCSIWHGLIPTWNAQEADKDRLSRRRPQDSCGRSQMLPKLYQMIYKLNNALTQVHRIPLANISTHGTAVSVAICCVEYFKTQHVGFLITKPSFGRSCCQ